MGMDYTPSVKNATMVAYEHIEDATFLKRRFVQSKELGVILAPLDLDSMIKSLMWSIPSSSVGETEQLRGTLISFFWELSLHEELPFDKIRAHLKSMYEEVYGKDVLSFPTLAAIRGQMFGSGELPYENPESTGIGNISIVAESSSTTRFDDAMCHGRKGPYLGSFVDFTPK
jgi:hypothetical protein